MLQSISSEKKMVKPLKNCFLVTNLHKKRSHYGPRPKWKTIFFGRNNKSRSPAFRNLLFYQYIYVLTELWIFFYLEWCFFVNKVPFLAKRAVVSSWKISWRLPLTSVLWKYLWLNLLAIYTVYTANKLFKGTKDDYCRGHQNITM